MHINKFAKTTIITYCKNNPILTSKCTKESFQVSFNINFIKYMFIWRSSVTSSIYRLLMPLAHKNIHQHKRKKMRRNWVRNLMLTCSNVYTYLSHFLLTFTNTKERIWKEVGQGIWWLMFKCLYLSFSFSLILLLLLLYLDFILTFPLLLLFLFFFFCKHVHTINLFLIHLLYFFMHLYLGYTRMHETPSFCSLDIFFENIKMC